LIISTQTRFDPIASSAKSQISGWSTPRHHQHDGSAADDYADDVSTARTLLARKASTATATASRMLHLRSEKLRSVFSELLQRFLGQLVLAVQLQRGLIFAARSARILLALLQPPEPVMRDPRARAIGIIGASCR